MSQPPNHPSPASGHDDGFVTALFAGPIGLAHLDAELRFIQVNETLASIHGRPVAAHLGKRIGELLPGLARRMEPLYRQVLETGTPVREIRLTRPAGPASRGGHWLASLLPVRDGEGVVTGIAVMVVDASERTLSREALSMAEARFRAICETAPIGITLLHPERGAEYVNPAQARMAGLPVERCLGRGMLEAVHPEDRDRVTREWEECLAAGRSFASAGRWLHPDGSVIPYRMRIAPVGDGKGAVCLTEDISARHAAAFAARESEERLAYGQKLESVGRLAGGIAHDFNNLLTVILSHAELMREPVQRMPGAADDLRQIESAAGRAATLIRQLLAFARRQVVVPRAVELNDLLRERERMLRRRLGLRIELELRLAPGRSSIRADPGQIEQLVINLAANARDAMPGGGRLTLETTATGFGDPGPPPPAGLEPGEYVVLTVSDTGVGMSPEVMAHAFDPFFTTKAIGQGSGLGLASCYGIVKQSGGHIDVSSEPGRGTSFRIYFPAVGEAATQASGGAPRSSAGAETILLVEDDDSLRHVAGRTLRRQGYSILEAASGAEALRLAGGSDLPIHLLLTDVVMPEMSGHDLAARLRALRPGLRVLFTSGYTHDAITRDGILDPEVNFIAKPYVPTLLSRRVRETLDGVPG